MTPRTREPIRVLNAALDEGPNGTIILRGVIAPESLEYLLSDDYQREVLPLSSLTGITKALQEGGTVPDIELGMRGHECSDSKGVYFLRNQVYIVDGQQRVSAARHVLQTNPDAKVRIGAAIHFGTNREWERERFRILNSLRARVSPNVLLRNKKDDNDAVALLYALTTSDTPANRSFVLNERVCWSQRMTRREIITALTVGKTLGHLHSHLVPGATGSVVEDLAVGLGRVLTVCGPQSFRGNVVTFFDLVDECWGVRKIHYQGSATHIKGSFLFTLARMLSRHLDFWQGEEGKRLFIEVPLRRKIAQFPVHDPSVVNLAGSSGKSHELLYGLLRDHINSGKRTRRLRERVLAADETLEEVAEV